jgi:transposase
MTFWTWVFHHGDSACFVIRPSRSKVVVAEFLGDFRPEIWISDRLGAQMGWATTDHQVCLAHYADAGIMPTAASKPAPAAMFAAMGSA